MGHTMLQNCGLESSHEEVSTGAGAGAGSPPWQTRSQQLSVLMRHSPGGHVLMGHTMLQNCGLESSQEGVGTGAGAGAGFTSWQTKSQQLSVLMRHSPGARVLMGHTMLQNCGLESSHEEVSTGAGAGAGSPPWQTKSQQLS